jgi:MFS family permease
MHNDLLGERQHMRENTDGVVMPSVGWHIMLAYLLAQYAAWLALLTPVAITIALRLSEITPASEKAGWLGLIMGIGAAAAMISAPIWGAISDKTTARIGKRKLWIIIGALSLLAGLLVMAGATEPVIFGLGWLICQIGSNAAQAALNAVMSDVIPHRQQGIMSALLGGSVIAAMTTGVFLTSFTSGNPLLMFVVPWLVTPVALAVFVWVVPDAPSTAAQMRAKAHAASASVARKNPFKSVDFTWAFASRFMVMMAWSFSATYQVYYLTDHLHISASKVAMYMTASTSIVGLVSLVVSLGGGWFSDKIGRRKPFVAGAAGIMALGLAGIATADDFTQFLAAMVLVSLGQGLYFAVDIALCVAVLPNKHDAARDLAVLQVASSLPQSLAPALAPIILGVALGGLAGANYPALFLAGGSMALIGAVIIVPIRGVR